MLHGRTLPIYSSTQVLSSRLRVRHIKQPGSADINDMVEVSINYIEQSGDVCRVRSKSASACDYSLDRSQVLRDCMPELSEARLEQKRAELAIAGVEAILVIKDDDLTLVGLLAHYQDRDYENSGACGCFVQEVGVRTNWQSQGIGTWMEHDALQVRAFHTLTLLLTLPPASGLALCRQMAIVGNVDVMLSRVDKANEERVTWRLRQSYMQVHGEIKQVHMCCTTPTTLQPKLRACRSRFLDKAIRTRRATSPSPTRMLARI